MKNNAFRSVEFWKSAVMTMPDNSFFELLRSVFGKIKTPFNKQQLINDLEAFLLRDDIQKTIAAYIDQNDAKVIAAVAIFGEPATGDLESFFTGELNYAQLQDIIVNMEERFILYRFSEENRYTGKNISRLALNPVLEQALLPFAADISALFPPVSKTEAADAAVAESAKLQAAPPVVLDDRILAGLLSFVLQEEKFFREEGVFRKRVIAAGKQLFPGLNLESVLGGLRILGLFYVDGDSLVPDKKRLDEFGCLSALERSEYCAAGLLAFNELKSQGDILPPLFRARITETVNFIHLFLNSLEDESLNAGYPEKSLNRLAEIFKARMNVDIANDALFESLEKTGLLVKVSAELRQRGGIAHNVEEKREGAFIAIDSGSSVLVYPEIGYEDAIKLAEVMDIREAGAVVRFELNKDSAIRAFDNNITANEIIELLNNLSGFKIDETLAWNLKDWEKRHGDVSLKKGVILSLSEEKRYVTKTRALAGLLRETLAPGLYLLDEDAGEDAADALRSAGIDIIARRKNKNSAGLELYSSSFSRTAPTRAFGTHSFFTNAGEKEELETKVSMVCVKAKTSRKTQAQAADAAALTANFHAILKKMTLSETERAELSARIDRHLILCEAQLKDANVRYEKLEARHMDYAGKQNIARQAIAQMSPVEIVRGGEKGERIFGIPKSLEKDGGELVLVIVPSNNEEVMRIPLGKISLLRRIKKSIFEK